MSNLIPRIIGTGWAVPAGIRYNDDPIFDWLKQHNPDPKLFDGYKERHVLGDGEDLIDIMLPAAQMALQKAGKQAADIDILLGLGSVSTYIQPNMLSLLHRELGLPPDAWVIPIGNDYSNYASSLLLADGLLRAGHAKNVLVCIGGSWTRNVDYHTQQSISAADGAGAAVMALCADESKWFVAGQHTVTDSTFYGSMYTSGEQLAANPPINGYSTVFGPHFFQITPQGMQGFKTFGTATALSAVTALLQEHNLSGSDISFMPHETSEYLIKYWCDNMPGKLGQVLSTIEQFANTTVATHALSMAWCEENVVIEKDNLVMLALGPDMHANAMLLKRGSG
ncbi:3-oxoacyl-[acyl-carrier-protein] synthase III [Cnuella takakiae]|uniref:3-oxoacyl-[acyl-carrier-protein] synthase III n=1 Tax=Cnuella takakiae TaxID=1302690 RepID=A0A1M4SZU7_9BACT|nr:hypothetical protein [Cnuella takakiae]OLY94577.1 hypothetical protein BUE76_01035 [Cnuella takakiae]SHE37748.1 3-oxoacyl-[acyl-carrier-protein] synthase III [Cnuella takakiae]